jgi:nucleoside-diphosphate kinase
MINFQELTLSIIKPDVVFQGKASALNDLLEQAGFNILLQKKYRLTMEEAENFYAEHRERGFFKELCGFLSSGPSIIQVLTSATPGVIERYRELMGATDPAKAQEGTIRKIFGTNIDYNAAHGSDSMESSTREILCFFNKNQILQALNNQKITKKEIFVKLDN